MSRCLATLGAFDARGDGWLVELDADSGAIRERLHVEPPPALTVAGKGLMGIARLPDGRLVTCGAAALHLIEGSKVVETWSAPSFNDLHGVTVADGRIWVANTGLDGIDVLDTDGRLVGHHGFEPQWLVSRRMAGETPTRAAWPALLETRWTGAPTDFEPAAPARGETYYRDEPSAPFNRRRVRDRVHPNHVAVVGGRPWVTCLALSALMDAVSFETLARFEAPPHDGLLRDDRLWFTRVDGVIEARHVAEPGRCIERWDASKASGCVGWCRGLHLTDDFVWVGFTEMRRPPRFPWSRAPLAHTRTAVVCLERTTRRPRQVFDLSLAARHTKVGALLGLP